MKLKGLAVFSIAIMALVAAPQAASDFQGFVSRLTTDAHSALIHALLNSQKEGPAAPVTRQEPGKSICSNWAPPVRGRAVQSKPAAGAPRFRASVARTSIATEDSNRGTAEIAWAETPVTEDPEAIDLRNVKVEDETRQAILTAVKSAAEVHSATSTRINIRYIQDAFKGLDETEKAVAFRECRKQWKKFVLPQMPQIKGLALPAVYAPAPPVPPADSTPAVEPDSRRTSALEQAGE